MNRDKSQPGIGRVCLGWPPIWGEATGGAIDLNMGEIIRVWKEAASANVLPDRAEPEIAKAAE